MNKVPKYDVTTDNYGKVIWQLAAVGGAVMLANNYASSRSKPIRGWQYWVLVAGAVIIGLYVGVVIYDYVWATIKTWLTDFIPFLELT